MPSLPIALLATAAFTAAPIFAADCATLKSITLPNTTITVAEQTGSTLTPPYGTPLTKLPSFCRVAGILHPTSDSLIRFELWLPEHDSRPGWNGRLLGTGNGGFAGSIYYDQMAAMLRQGYAVTGSDAGHEAEGEDAAFAFHHPEKINDFGWRAVHLNAVIAKQLLTAFYGHPQQKAYFDACSDGGAKPSWKPSAFPKTTTASSPVPPPTAGPA